MKMVTGQGIPFLSFCGYSESGKTTLLSRLLPFLKEQGLRVAVVKHDGHDFDMDRPGTDTCKFAEAGADTVVISSPGKLACLEKHPKEPSVFEILEGISHADLILIEGYKRERIPKLLVSRKGIPFPTDIPKELILGKITDVPQSHHGTCPVFTHEQVEELGRFVLAYMKEEPSIE